MNRFSRKGGVEVVGDDEIRVSDVGRAPPPSDGTGRRGRLPRGPIPMRPTQPITQASADELVRVLDDPSFVLLDSLEVSRAGVPRAERAPAEPTRLTVDLAEDEQAVVLLEQDEAYSWRFGQAEPAPARESRRRGVVVERARRRVMFDLDPEPALATAARRGLLGDLVLGAARAYVFKFAARAGLRMGVHVFERKQRTGLVLIAGVPIERWVPIDSLNQIQLPIDRPARILLLVHGTFSSTVGSFGALVASPWGQEFLGAALERYDAVLGFDHKTLSADPRQNASDLLGALETWSWPLPPAIDAIAYSRGGLVLRSLIEGLLPTSTIRARVWRAVFVGCTNDGTQLASPANWTRLVDLYTNLATSGVRALGLFPQFAGAAVILRESVEAIAALVKYLAVTAVDDRAVPGLAAMEPHGKFVNELNETQPGQPTDADSFYSIVTSDFTAAKALEQGVKGLPERLLRWAIDNFADSLMREPNDLVVNTSSMAAIDLGAGTFVKDRLDFGANPHVYHTVYFTRREVSEALSKWFDPATPTLGAKTQISVRADPSLVVVDSSEPASEVMARIPEPPPAFVVVQRPDGPGFMNYAYRIHEIREAYVSAIQRGTSTNTLENVMGADPALAMYETSRSPTGSAAESGSFIPARQAPPTRRRMIVMEDGRPRSVVAEATEVVGTREQISEFDRTSGPGTTGPWLRRAGPLPEPTVVLASRDQDSPTAYRYTRGAPMFDEEIAPPAAAPEMTWAPIPQQTQAIRPLRLFVSASMPKEVEVERSSPLEVRVSGEEIAIALGPTSARASFIAVPGREVTVLVIPKRNLRVDGDDRATFDPANPPELLVFDVRGTNVGDGEIWVIVRQGPIAVAQLTLKPVVCALFPGGHIPQSIRSAVEGQSAPATIQSFPTLQIFDWSSGNERRLKFILDLGQGNLKTAESNVLATPKETYVRELYEKIEARWVTTKHNVDAFREEMRSLGATLLNELVPSAIQAELWRVRDELQSIQVISEEPFIPWELVHLKPPSAPGAPPSPLPNEVRFLAQKGLVRWLHNVGEAPQEIRVRKGRARYAIPSYPHQAYRLPAAQAEIPFLEKELHATPVTAETNAVRELLRGPGSLDLFHFSGHGEADATHAVEGRLMMTGEVQGATYVPDYLAADIVATHAQLPGADGSRPLIFLNACQVGRAGWRLTSIGGFASSFLNAGAGVFVGSLWSVGDTPAASFSEAFYTQLLRGKTLATSTIAGRDAAQAAGEATWLAYVVYGYPFATLTLI